MEKKWPISKCLKTTWRKQIRGVIIMSRLHRYKTTGANGTGTATFYKMTSQFVFIKMDYVKKRSDPYFTLQAVLEDASSDRNLV
ncbi:phage tail tube protein [Bacillus sp. ATD]|uniref:phage tail tube protein n=1 Tax=Bacillus sp. ATD TaxID=3422305 RepID=UPI003D3473E0